MRGLLRASQLVAVLGLQACGQGAVAPEPVNAAADFRVELNGVLFSMPEDSVSFPSNLRGASELDSAAKVAENFSVCASADPVELLRGAESVQRCRDVTAHPTVLGINVVVTHRAGDIPTGESFGDSGGLVRRMLHVDGEAWTAVRGEVYVEQPSAFGLRVLKPTPETVKPLSGAVYWSGTDLRHIDTVIWCDEWAVSRTCEHRFHLPKELVRGNRFAVVLRYSFDLLSSWPRLQTEAERLVSTLVVRQQD